MRRVWIIAGTVLIAACSESTTAVTPSARAASATVTAGAGTAAPSVTPTSIASLATAVPASAPPPSAAAPTSTPPAPTQTPAPVTAPPPTVARSAPPAGAAACPARDKFALWSSGKALLRGANVYMGRDPRAPDPTAFGDGPFTQADFDDLAKAGANYVQISHAGLFRETAPYDLDPSAQANLDSVIKMAANAGLYAVIAYRTGPGRNETAILRDGPVLESIWTSEAEQTAWVAMMRYTAARYRADPTVVGYDPMVEPNDYVRRGSPDPQAFYAQYGGTLEDFNGLARRVTSAVREVDQTTPLLLEPDGFGGIPFLPFLKVTGDPRTVYTVHDYTPFDYAHELRPALQYPGTYDVNGFGDAFVDKTYLERYLSSVKTYGQEKGVPVAMTEWGGHRTAANIATYMRDRIDLQDPIGNWAVWTWQPAGFIDPFSVHDPSPTNTVLRAAWASNCVRAN